MNAKLPIRSFDIEKATVVALQRAEAATLPPTKRCTEVKQHNTFYASKLVKLSSRHYAFLASKEMSFTPTREQMLGNTMAEIALDGVEQEVGGSVDFEKYKIVFNADGIHVDENIWCFEHKYLFKGQPDSWKIQSAATQLLFYTALTSLKRGDSLKTALYKRTEIKNVFLPKNKNLMMCLVVTLPDKVVCWTHQPTKKQIASVLDFYLRKSDAIKNAVGYNWDQVNEWDLKFKHKEHLEFFPELSIEDFKSF
jgi:hypothetical protein